MVFLLYSSPSSSSLSASPPFCLLRVISSLAIDRFLSSLLRRKRQSQAGSALHSFADFHEAHRRFFFPSFLSTSLALSFSLAPCLSLSCLVWSFAFRFLFTWLDKCEDEEEDHEGGRRKKKEVEEERTAEKGGRRIEVSDWMDSWSINSPTSVKETSNEFFAFLPLFQGGRRKMDLITGIDLTSWLASFSGAFFALHLSFVSL